MHTNKFNDSNNYVCMKSKFLDYKHGEVRGSGEQRCVKQMCVAAWREGGGWR